MVKVQLNAMTKYRVFISDGKNEAGYQDVFAKSAEEAEAMVQANLDGTKDRKKDKK